MANIVMSLEEIDEIVSKLKQASDEIEHIWESIQTKEITRIKEVWRGKDSEAYLNKFQTLDIDVTNALKAQRLLAATFEKARNQVTEAQNKVVTKTDAL